MAMTQEEIAAFVEKQSQISTLKKQKEAAITSTNILMAAKQEEIETFRRQLISTIAYIDSQITSLENN